jgi:hypothetical protein
VKVDVKTVTLTAPDTVESDYVLTGPDIPPLPNPFSAHATFTVQDGKITRMVQTLSEQTVNDLMSMPQGGEPAGMPSTGAGIAQWTPWVLVAVGATLLVALGALLVTRFSTDKR